MQPATAMHQPQQTQYSQFNPTQPSFNAAPAVPVATAYHVNQVTAVSPPVPAIITPQPAYRPTNRTLVKIHNFFSF